MIYLHVRTRWCCGERADELAIGYRRKPTPATSLRKALAMAVLFVALTIASFAALELTDVPDHKPTAILRP